METPVTSVLPHRYPFLLIDRVTEVEPGVWARGYKNVSINEWFFQGHFPDEPIMPGVLITEAMAQLGAFAIHKPGQAPFAGMIASIKEIKFHKPVLPGDRLDLFYEVLSHKGPYVKGNAQASVKGETVAKAAEMIVYLKGAKGQ
ncbi:3-hydroxyacyl-ACP dehydratase FabZ [Paenibacillus sp. UNC499MF]|uniref:3-hydroxyacyl-ACP dehydratase FabZ n=1 Tax=Paenibacillus sp. UNC499MF TaxID=1502751 RepID=UPI0008A07A7F|nr:3-hydroxyacyl-ACP dehydratase FabZ [Paenibacillus sp. UNC499MF]SEG71388.1 3-hydroxyacyl-[acyl-carrier-protein] dehydratase [Paenibacillus sp. UNC499MF]